VIDLSAEQEPAIHAAIRFGSALENVVYDPATSEAHYSDGRVTENTRVATRSSSCAAPRSRASATIPTT
jgi:ATP-dependent phosphoenolpyruvate carboxykinase